MTKTERAGRTGMTQRCAGLDLDVEDYVKHDGTWYKIVAVDEEIRSPFGARTVRTRAVRGVTATGGRRALLLDSRTVTAYRWNR